MTLLLGIDTGGTYTDSVLFDEAGGHVVSAAKSLTTKHDLSLCVGDAIDRALDAGPPDARSRIGLVSLSTTLATNAIVERHGFPVGLVLIGQSRAALDRAGLAEALGGDPVVLIAGGHQADGQEQAPLDEAALMDGIAMLREKAAAVAVSGYFAVRNPTHERRARDLIRRETGMPVSCGHELASALDAPRRALTALLNARLIPLLQQLILAVRDHLARRGIEAPLMVVKGDGSLIAAETALMRPVETILSGPAASVVGARALSGEANCIVSDIGGTTTDIAILNGGRPVMDPDGASVGGYRTMVEAVAVRTLGLGGDSQIRLDDEKRLVVGPRRVVPLSLLARDHPAALETLREQARRAWPKTHDGRFALRLRGLGGAKLSRNEAMLWDRLETGPVSLEALFAGRPSEQPLQRLVDRGFAILAGFTPSDAAHRLGLQTGWNLEAATLGAELWARSDRRPGHPVAPDGESFARQVIERVIRQSGEAILDAAMAEETRRRGRPPPPPSAAASPSGGSNRPGGSNRRFLDAALAPKADSAPPAEEDGDTDAAPLVSFSVTLNRPLIGIGAPATTYYPAIAERLNSRLAVPTHSDVCNAVGAVAGGVSQSQSVLITAPEEGRFRVHGEGGPEDFSALTDAAARATDLARGGAERKAREAGADEIRVEVTRADRVASVAGGHEVFVESAINATAYGRPRLTPGRPG
ncbi:hydantoinase/oxoprolinase family protein [Marivibrio halodurans]|uniref:Hydantoinase/oxoprolinase family protein n=1 Tax=Marivibrio halodurans TaxID=2039722 RepID=A0A8J7S4Y4_9PROT|nr:hydantoinase/oxoprolinase family protein [Marivibrio halodurans]MBP5858854.1 hydantoinase/oxoprolinase family protein [Marivibrio halodurans]